VEPPVAVLERPNKESVTQYLEGLDTYKQSRDTPAVARTLDGLATAANSERQNVYAAVVTAATAGATHGEIVARLREEFGTGDPLIVP
jgi:methylmalonyl-CoA mutase N-terminal domain/subunit